MSLVAQAVTFAAQRHHGQMRKDRITPYVAHPFRVLFILRDLFDVKDPETLAAGVLHDTIEDTTTDHDDLLRHFGPRVAGFVTLLTKDKRMREEERERAYFEGLRTAPVEVKLCKLADSLDNVMDRDALAPEGREKALKKARLLIQTFEPGFPKEWTHALERLKTAVK
ncbi:MAG: bifunctional (p)ppGpp synthetase/guanosine-3',5'-bis(diphosphate) 3'-pyrophosphohydrolase [Planctomycetes bacterium]|nr:bifunctional (p)ppGpp synthetase/guanosine-3',5'-bis(diphosphate) 3'-pyrophosphohydrolase [Planctomycetota bacterium]